MFEYLILLLFIFLVAIPTILVGLGVYGIVLIVCIAIFFIYVILLMFTSIINYMIVSIEGFLK